MATNMVSRKSGALATRTSVRGTSQDDLSSGLSGGFAVMSFRSGRWRVKYQGSETVITRKDEEDNDVPVASIDVVLLKASRNVSKIYYSKPFSDGDAEAPDCYSSDGIRPDAGVLQPKSKSCATCKFNEWGSKITPNGKKAKACSDHRRVAITPASLNRKNPDPSVITNEVYNGPMLLRVPPTSLNDLAQYGQRVASTLNETYDAVVTRLGFDTEASYPKLTFKPVRLLTDEENEAVDELFHDDRISRVINSAVELADEEDDDEVPAPRKAKAKPVVEEDEEEEAPPVKAKAKTKPVVEEDEEEEEEEAPPVKAKAKAKSKPVVEEEDEEEEEEAPPVKVKPKAKAKPVVEEDEEDEEDEPVKPTKPAKKGKKGEATVAAQGDALDQIAGFLDLESLD
jgi:hypothetical protein